MRRLTDGFAVVIALAAFAVSYSTQADLASHHGFPGWQAWAWPGIADAAALAMILSLHFGKVKPGLYTWEAWGVFAFAALIMVLANGIADRNDLLGAAMHGVVPVVAMLVCHVRIHGSPVTPKPSKEAQKQAAYRARKAAGWRVVPPGGEAGNKPVTALTRAGNGRVPSEVTR